jgi:LacI family transcriptional regulator
MKRKGHITLDDIARKLSVSRVTVSKALRGHPDISADMTKRVRKAADEFGYTPNIFARSLSSRRSGMLGLVVPKIAHFFFGSVIEGVYDTALANKYETILTVSQENPEREKMHLQTLMSMRVDGIIISISQTTRDLDIFQTLRKRGVPLLFLDRCPEPAPRGFNSVVVDDKGGTYKAVEQAIKVGYRKIACIGGDTHINIGKNRLEGFEGALKAHSLQINKEWIVTGGYGKNIGYDGLMRFYSSGRMPEFIFAMTYPIALGIYEAAKELGLKIPYDVDVMCFGDSDVSRVISPALSCVMQPASELGSKAVELMLKTIAHPDVTDDQHIVLPTEILLRETCTGKNTINAGRGPIPTRVRVDSSREDVGA